MRRLYEPYAYSEAPLEHCLWTDRTVPPRPPLEDEARTEVAVIGGGYTGLSAALHLAEAGVQAVVLEARRIGWGASGRNAGFCCLGSSLMSSRGMRRRFGDDGWRAHRDAELASVRLVRDLLAQHRIDAEVQEGGETVLAHSPRAMAALRHAAEEVAHDYGVTAQVHAATDLPGLGMAGGFYGGMTTPVGFGIHPRKYVLGLARAAEAAGAVLHEASPVTAIAGQDGFTLTTPRGRLRADRLIVATNGYSSDDLPGWLRGRYLPLQSNILATRPLTGDELAAQGWRARHLLHDSRKLLHYFRLLPDNRFLFGMRGGVYATPRANARLKRKIHADFETLFPAWAGIARPYFWSGLVCLSPGRTPFAGPIPELPGAFAGLAYHGNGVAMASYAGRLLAEFARGVTPELPYPPGFARPPRPLPFGRHRRILLQAATTALTSVD